MGSDLFGSFAESTVAALVVSGNSPDLLRSANFLYPLIISSLGILVCLITTSFTPLFSIKQDKEGVKCKIIKWMKIKISVFIIKKSIKIIHN